MSARKATRRPKARSANNPHENPQTALEVAQAVLKIHGNKKFTAANPFVSISAVDTIDYVAKGLEVMSQLSYEDSGLAINKELEFGEFLILQTMMLALQTAREQARHEKEIAGARAVVDALGGAK